MQFHILFFIISIFLLALSIPMLVISYQFHSWLDKQSTFTSLQYQELRYYSIIVGWTMLVLGVFTFFAAFAPHHQLINYPK